MPGEDLAPREGRVPGSSLRLSWPGGTPVREAASSLRPGVRSNAVNPGWVKTDMGGENAQLEPEESIEIELIWVERVVVDRDAEDAAGGVEMHVVEAVR